MQPACSGAPAPAACGWSHSSCGSVKLHEQGGSGIRAITGVSHLLGRLNGQPVHHLDRSGTIPAATISLTASPAPPVSSKKATSVRTASGLGTTRRVIRVATPSVPSEPTNAPSRSYPGQVAVQLDQRAVGQHDLEPGDVVGGEAILEAVCAARVLGDVSADRAHHLAGGVGRVEVSGGNGPRDRQIGDARLDHHPGVLEVHGEDPSQPGQDDQDALGHRQRATGQAGTRSPGHPGNPGLKAGPDHVSHLLGGSWQHSGQRDLPVLGQAVGAIGGQVVAMGQNVFSAADGLQTA